MTFNQITIVITSYKSDEKIVKCLKSINNQCKTIVIENSKDIFVEFSITIILHSLLIDFRHFIIFSSLL